MKPNWNHQVSFLKSKKLNFFLPTKSAQKRIKKHHGKPRYLYILINKSTSINSLNIKYFAFCSYLRILGFMTLFKNEIVGSLLQIFYNIFIKQERERESKSVNKLKIVLMKK